MESLDTPIFSATLCALRVLAPPAYISTTAGTRAQPTNWHRSITSSGKKLSERSFRDARRQRADAGGEAALAVAVAIVRSDAAHSVGLGVQHGVHDLIGEPAQQLLHIDGAVFEPGHGEHVRRQAW